MKLKLILKPKLQLRMKTERTVEIVEARHKDFYRAIFKYLCRAGNRNWNQNNYA